MHGYFYYDQLRTYSQLMSNLFGSIYIKKRRDEKDYIQQVPITYGNKEFFISKMNQSILNILKPNPKYLNIEQILPRMNILLIDCMYDPERKTFTRNKTQKVNTENTKFAILQYNPIPYRLTYELNIYARYQDDLNQIAEQIMAYFAPSFVCKIVELRENKIEIEHNVPITILGITPDELVLGLATGRRHLEWLFTFQLNGYIYPPNINLSGLIKTMYINLNASDTDDDMTEITDNFELFDVQVDDLDSTEETWDGEFKYSFSNNTKIPDDGSIRGTNISKGNIHDK